MDTAQLTTADLANAANRGMDTDEEYRGVPAANEEDHGPLLPGDFSNDMRTRWENIQTGFVDDPRAAVKHADELVAAAMTRLADSFASERKNLEQQWSRGEDVSTEDLRQALRKYRAFFQRLLAV